MTIRSFFRYQCHELMQNAEKVTHNPGNCVLHFARVCKIPSRVFLNSLICTICIQCECLCVYMCIHGCSHTYVHAHIHIIEIVLRCTEYERQIQTYVPTYIHLCLHAYFLSCMHDRKCTRKKTTKQHNEFGVSSSCMLCMILQQNNQNCQQVYVGMGGVRYDWDGKLCLSSRHFSKIGVLTLSSLLLSILTSSCKTALLFPTDWICAYYVTVKIKFIIYLYRVYRLVLLMEAYWVFCEVDIYIYIL